MDTRGGYHLHASLEVGESGGIVRVRCAIAACGLRRTKGKEAKAGMERSAMTERAAYASMPLKAQLFLLVPIFNFYWVFVVFCGLYKDMNRIIESYAGENETDEHDGKCITKSGGRKSASSTYRPSFRGYRQMPNREGVTLCPAAF